MRPGIALVPEDRNRPGLALGLPVGTNVSIAALPVSKAGMIDYRAERSLSRALSDGSTSNA